MDHTLVEGPHSDPVSDSEYDDVRKSLVSIRLGTFVRPSSTKHRLKTDRISCGGASILSMTMVFNTHVYII